MGVEEIKQRERAHGRPEVFDALESESQPLGSDESSRLVSDVDGSSSLLADGRSSVVDGSLLEEGVMKGQREERRNFEKRRKTEKKRTESQRIKSPALAQTLCHTQPFSFTSQSSISGVWW